MRYAVTFLLAGLTLPTIAQSQDKASLPTDTAAALDRISADSLKGHLSFLASDLLEGRNTPSRGQEIAAEYIAAQFRRAGLEPAGDDGYFQVANWQALGPDESSFSLELRIGGDTYRVHPEAVSLSGAGKLDLDGLALLRVADEAALAGLTAAQVEGRAVLITLPDAPQGSARLAQPGANAGARRSILNRLRELKAALVVTIDPKLTRGSGLGSSTLIDPEGPSRRINFRLGGGGTPIVAIHDPKVIEALNGISGQADARVTLKLGEPVKRPVRLKNVAGLLRGSDPALKDTYILITAHYDHIGLGTPVNGDAIFNGANDDGSGTVSVVEIALALGTLKERPKRSILFVTFFGEEHGLLGSKYYGRHPLVPIAKTVADVNLEQVGRTDDLEGPRVAGASLTGMDYSDVGKVFAAAGEAEGVKVTRHPRNSDAFFGASDNQALADLGVPAHTLCTAFMYPDYHGLGDHWDKIDYANMAKIDRTVARAVLMIAQEAEAPQWDASNKKADRYRKAREASLAK